MSTMFRPPLHLFDFGRFDLFGLGNAIDVIFTGMCGHQLLESVFGQWGPL